MVPLSPQSLIISARTLALMGAQDDYTFGDAPPRLLHAGSLERWDLRFVHRCGYASHYDHRSRTSSWPLPMDLTHMELVQFAADHGILRDEPAAGDVFLVSHSRTKTFIQAGVIASVEARGCYDHRTPYFDAYTIVGDTDETGSPGRGRTMRLNRRLLPAQGDRFLRWSDMDANGGMIRYNRSTFLRDAAVEVAP
jgi:hypothetical protein